MKKFILGFVFTFIIFQNCVFAQDQEIPEYYIMKIASEVSSNWLMPVNRKGKYAVISYDIDKNGRVIKVKLLKSSNNKDFDKSVILAVYKAEPFDCFPPDTSTEILQFQTFFSPDFISTIRTNNPNNKIIFKDYLAELKKKIDSKWYPSSSDETKKITATFRINKCGSVKNLEILQITENDYLEEEVLNAILRAVPFNPLPPEFNGRYIDVKFDFNYDFDVNSSSTLANNIQYSIINDSNKDEALEKYKKQVHVVTFSNLAEIIKFSRKKPTLLLAVNRSGDLVYSAIGRSSGNKEFDEKVLEALRKCSFPPIPEVTGLNTLTFWEDLQNKNQVYKELYEE